MSQKSDSTKASSTRLVEDHLPGRALFGREENPDRSGCPLRGEHSVAELSRREGIAKSLSSSSGICQCARRWRSLALRAPASIPGAIFIRPADLRPWKTNCRGRHACGTGSPTRCAGDRAIGTRRAGTVAAGEGYFVSEDLVYRLLKAHDLTASPAFIVVKAADDFKDETTADRLHLFESDWLG